LAKAAWILRREIADGCLPGRLPPPALHNRALQARMGNAIPFFVELAESGLGYMKKVQHIYAPNFAVLHRKEPRFQTPFSKKANGT
jgi:hypothetical protein